LYAILAAAFAMLPAHDALGWFSAGHVKATQAAMAAAGDKLPPFFVAGGETIAKTAAQPDFFTRPVATQPLHATESADHYCDLELLDFDGGKLTAPLPATREQYVLALARKDKVASKVGLLPYAMAEHTQRLTVAFAQHRRWPQDKAIQQQCLVYAGLLAHYAQDSCQPLHTTVDYDGRADKEGKSPRSGIHLKVDALIGKLASPTSDIAKLIAAQPADRKLTLLEYAAARLEASHALVDGVYKLAEALPAPDDDLPAQGPVVDFAQERLAAAAQVTLELYLRAWADSADVEIPDWKDIRAVFGPPASQPATAPASAPAATVAAPAPPPAGVGVPLPPPPPPQINADGSGVLHYQADGVQMQAQWSGPAGTAVVTTRPDGGVSVEVRSTGGRSRSSVSVRSATSAPAGGAVE
jgi:hypothetical protein